MIISIGLLPRYRGQHIEEFLRLWSAHAVWAKVVPKRIGYVQNFAVIKEGRHLLPYPGFDVCAETVYQDEAAMEEAYLTPQSQDSFDDHSKFVDERGYCHVLSHERRVRVNGTPPIDAVKLMTFMRSNPTGSREQFIESVTGPYADIIDRGSPIRHEQMVASHPADRAGNSPSMSALMRNLLLSPCDVLDQIWFRTPEEAVAFVHSELAYAAALAIAGTTFGTERLIARPRTNTPPADLESK